MFCGRRMPRWGGCGSRRRPTSPFAAGTASVRGKRAGGYDLSRVGDLLYPNTARLLKEADLARWHRDSGCRWSFSPKRPMSD